MLPRVLLLGTALVVLLLCTTPLAMASADAPADAFPTLTRAHARDEAAGELMLASSQCRSKRKICNARCDEKYAIHKSKKSRRSCYKKCRRKGRLCRREEFKQRSQAVPLGAPSFFGRLAG